MVHNPLCYCNKALSEQVYIKTIFINFIFFYCKEVKEQCSHIFFLHFLRYILIARAKAAATAAMRENDNAYSVFRNCEFTRYLYRRHVDMLRRNGNKNGMLFGGLNIVVVAFHGVLVLIYNRF